MPRPDLGNWASEKYVVSEPVFTEEENAERDGNTRIAATKTSARAGDSHSTGCRLHSKGAGDVWFAGRSGDGFPVVSFFPAARVRQSVVLVSSQLRSGIKK